jgi:hypothetical protein
MTDSFWKNAARSLPPEVRWRYAKLFEAAERYERLLDLALDAGGHALRALRGATRRAERPGLAAGSSDASPR